jgi:hypothetical protein
MKNDYFCGCIRKTQKPANEHTLQMKRAYHHIQKSLNTENEKSD